LETDAETAFAESCMSEEACVREGGVTRPVARGMGADELLRLPVAVDLETANRALGLGRSKGYELAKRGRYPCRVLRLGNAYRVVTADLRVLLGLAP
jgi:hypothetical protein